MNAARPARVSLRLTIRLEGVRMTGCNSTLHDIGQVLPHALCVTVTLRAPFAFRFDLPLRYG